MRKTILTNGTIAGVILILFFVVARILGTFGGSYGEIIGYATMVAALSFVFIGVKKIRDQNDGKISFLKAFLYGFYISLIACAFYVIGWMIVDADNTFIVDYAAKAIQKLKESGASEEEIAKTQEQMDGYMKLYANPITKAGVTLMEILPVGIIVSLITAAVLKKN